MTSTLLSLLLASSTLSGPEIVDRSIRYHDPDSDWFRAIVTMELRETRPEGIDRDASLVLDVVAGEFDYEARIGDHTIRRALLDGDCLTSLDGRTELTHEEQQEHGLDCARIGRYRDYYRYVWGIPMVLTDPGTIIDPDASFSELDGEKALRVRVTYDEEVGTDVWYFYFDPETFAVRGARFFHDESANDGEVIVFEGEISAGSLTLPRERHWYTNAEDRHLGSDLLDSLELTTER